MKRLGVIVGGLLFLVPFMLMECFAASAIVYNSQTGAWAISKNAATIAAAEKEALSAVVGGQVMYSSDRNPGYWSISVAIPNFLGMGNPGFIGFAYGYSNLNAAGEAAMESCQKVITSPWKEKGLKCNLNETHWLETVSKKDTTIKDSQCRPMTFSYYHPNETDRLINVQAETGKVVMDSRRTRSSDSDPWRRSCTLRHDSNVVTRQCEKVYGAPISGRDPSSVGELTCAEVIVSNVTCEDPRYTRLFILTENLEKAREVGAVLTGQCTRK